MVSDDFVKQLSGYGLATAHILYRMPDYPALLQTYIWQQYDVCPKFPELKKFLDFWSREIEGQLHSVKVVHEGLIKPAEIRSVSGLYHLH